MRLALAALSAPKAKPEPAAEPAKPSNAPQEIERLYEAGGDLAPSNASARKALDRIQSELLQGGQH